MQDEPEAEIQLSAGEHTLADRLATGRPVPAAGFRGALARFLAARDPGYGPRPERLRMTILAYVLPGLLLIGAGALIATGVL
jgi:hypothetical protein